MFAGLAVVVPVLAHSTWHLYRKVVEPAASGRDAPGAVGYWAHDKRITQMWMTSATPPLRLANQGQAL